MKLLVPVVLVVAGIVAVCAFRIGADGGRSPSPAAERTSGAPTIRTSSRPTPDAQSTPFSWEPAAEAFVDAFLSTGRGRGARLEAAATSRLSKLLVETDSAHIPTGGPMGEPSHVADGSGTVTVAQQLSDGSAFEFDLVRDSSRDSSWVVTTVRSRER